MLHGDLIRWYGQIFTATFAAEFRFLESFHYHDSPIFTLTVINFQYYCYYCCCCYGYITRILLLTRLSSLPTVCYRMSHAFIYLDLEKIFFYFKASELAFFCLSCSNAIARYMYLCVFFFWLYKNDWRQECARS